MTELKISLSAVEYLNTKPFLAGLSAHDVRKKLLITQDSPAQCSYKLRSGLADIGIVPLADLSELQGFRRITEWGICSDGPVESVLLVAHQPIEKLKRILLDYQSKTSNQLMRILAEDYFGCTSVFEETGAGYEGSFDISCGAVIIGDRALKTRGRFAYQYDLSEAWKQLTGLPFVFAVWVASMRVNKELEAELDQALQSGVKMVKEVASEFMSDFPGIDINHYLSNCIQYRITENHESAIELFFEKIQMKEGILK
ncbi:MAG: menaquinone biosynthesis protein [Saprospiraceae bacterium]|nr:menaquinone biosynthesis protein [Saprospiraceae bacterium]